VWVCVFVGFLMCVYVCSGFVMLRAYMCVFLMCVCMYGFCNVCVCVGY